MSLCKYFYSTCLLLYWIGSTALHSVSLYSNIMQIIHLNHFNGALTCNRDGGSFVPTPGGVSGTEFNVPLLCNYHSGLQTPLLSPLSKSYTVLL